MSDFGEVSFTSVQSQSVDVAEPNFGGIELSTFGDSNSNKALNSQSPYNSTHGLEPAERKENDYQYQQDEFEGEPGVSSVFGASFNFINSIVGAGIIAIPSAIQQCGLVLGVLLLMMVAYLVNCSVLMLIDCGLKNGKYDLEELAEHLLGRRGYYFTLVFMFLFAYGAQVAYLVVLGDTVPRAAQLLAPGSFFCSRFNTLLLLSTLFILPLSSFRKLSTLAWTSMVSIAGDVVVILIVLVACVSLSGHHQDEHFEVSDIDQVNDSLFAGVGTMGFAFVCQHNSFMVFRSLAQPTKAEWRKVAGLSVSFAWFVCTAFGLIGFFTFFPYVQGDLLNNFAVNDVWIACARLFLAFTMVLTYPMECYVTRHCALSIITKVYDDRRERLGAEAVDNSACGRLSNTLSAATSTLTDKITAYTAGFTNYMSSADKGENRSPSNRHQGNTYTNVEEEGEDVTIMFVENKVLMMYDVSIDDTADDSAVDSGSVNPMYDHTDSAVKENNTGSSNPLHATSYKVGATNNTNNTSNANLLKNTNNPQNNSSTGARRRVSSADTIQTSTSTTHLPATDRASTALHMSMTLLLWGSSLSIAMVFEKLGVVSALTGAVAASMLGFVLPAVLYLKTHEREVRHAYDAARSVYYDGNSNSNDGTRGASAIHGSSVANPLSYDAHRSASPSGDAEVTIEFNRVDDTYDGEANIATARTVRGVRTTNNTHTTSYLCNPFQHIKGWRMIEPFRKFWLSFFMIVFGLICMIIGIVTVFVDNS